MKKSIGVLFLLLPRMIFAQVEEMEKPQIEIGGAFRFNYNLSSWKEGQKKRGGDFGYDVFILKAKANYRSVEVNAEYRLYSTGSGGGMLKQGWVGYKLNDQDDLQFGLTQVPFGNAPYNSHNWFLSSNYYIGLEDDYDMGIKYTHSGDKWGYALAFFKNSEELEFGNNTDVSDSRYSYDVSSSGDGLYRNKEVNQLNAQLFRNLFTGRIKHKVGVSGQLSGIYNLDTENTGFHYAMAAHYTLVLGNFDVMAQYTQYKYNPKNPADQTNDIIAMAAGGSSYLVASEGRTYTIGAAYTLPIKWKPITSLQFYDDFGMLDKTQSSFEDTYTNVAGILVNSGNAYVYVELAQGKNQPNMGAVWTEALANGTPGAGWGTRFNINFGYYF